MAALAFNDRLTGPFIATGGQVDFDGDFPLIDAPGDPVGTCVFVVRQRAGVRTFLELGEFAILQQDDDGFTVRLAAGSVTGDRVFIVGHMAQKRSRAHPPGGAVRTPTLEDDAREAAAKAQEAQRDLRRAILVPHGDAPPDPERVALSIETTLTLGADMEIVKPLVLMKPVGQYAYAVPINEALDAVYLVSFYPNGEVSGSGLLNQIALQRAGVAAATLGRGQIIVPGGQVNITGRVDFPNGNIRLVGSGRAQSVLVQTSIYTCDTLHFSGPNCGLDNIGLYCAGASNVGSVLKVEGFNFNVSHVNITNGWVGVEVTNGGGLTGSDLDIANCMYSCLHVHGGVQDMTVNQLVMNGGTQLMGTGGNLRIEGFVSALSLSQWKTLSGMVPIYTDSVFVGNALQPAYGIFATGYMDGFARSGVIRNSKQLDFPDSWISGGRDDETPGSAGFPALVIINSPGVRFPNLRGENCGRQVIAVDGTSDDFSATEARLWNNGQNTPSTGISIAAGNRGSKVTATGGNDTRYYSGGQQTSLVALEAGASDYCRLELTGRGNLSGVVSNSSTGTHNVISAIGT